MSKQREALESILQMLGDPMSPLEAKIIVTAYEALAEPEPLTDEQLLECLISVDSETKRLPMGFKLFARAIERAHGIGEL